MKRSSGPRKTANLSQSTNPQLNKYALAAGAAGVGVLALASAAEAKIVYTKAHVPIIGRVNLDLNHDGIKDFTINHRNYGHTNQTNVFSLRQNRVWGAAGSASTLPAGVRVGSNQAKFQKGRSPCTVSYAGPCKLMQLCYANGTTSFCEGPWLKATSGYLGLKFHIKGQIHFGSARLNRKTVADQWVLTGYAYETIPNRPIVTGKTKGTDDEGGIEQPTASLAMPTPEPATLGALAMGAPGLSIWRRKET
jgi:hypothetical protein